MLSELSPRRKLLQAALFPLWKLLLKPRGPGTSLSGREAREGRTLFSGRAAPELGASSGVYSPCYRPESED